MTQLELKSHFINWSMKLITEKELAKLYEYFIFLKQNYQQSESGWWDELSEEQKNNLDIAIEQCNDPSKLISHEKVVAESKKWLKK